MRRPFSWLADNSLSLAFFGLFAVTLIAGSFAGLAAENAERADHGMGALSFSRYVTSGAFADGIFVNWQAAFLQLACLIVFARALRQKGASHSRKPEGNTRQEQGGEHPTGARRIDTWLRNHSLALGFWILFGLSFGAHLAFGTLAYNEGRSLTRDPPVTMASYLLTGDFWFKNFSAWEAEFVVMGAFIVLSIYLRERGSAESKPVSSSDEETGETNK